jgi:hypothetical protein
MKRLLVLTALFLLSISTLVEAQNHRGDRQVTVEERAKMITEWMMQELNLTSEQIAPVDSINLLYTKAQQIIFQSAADGNREKIREMMEALEKEKVVSLSTVLTDEQLALYKEKRDTMRENRRRRV